MISSPKGIILAGGTGTRLHPITLSISKQLLPVYDKPMIHYPLTTLMLSGIRNILIITTPEDQGQFIDLLGNGRELGMNIEYAIQETPRGLADAFLVGEKFINGDPVTLILGDNLFHGKEMINQFQKSLENEKGATVFAYPVKDPERYAVVEFNSSGEALSIEEKPTKARSRNAITGIYFYDSTVVDKAKRLTPSNRGELEITDLNKLYLQEGDLHVERLGRGMAWLDTGTFDSLYEAAGYIRTIEQRQGFKVGCPEEVAWRLGWISDNELEKIACSLLKSGYGSYLLELLNSNYSYS